MQERSASKTFGFERQGYIQENHSAIGHKESNLKEFVCRHTLQHKTKQNNNKQFEKHLFEKVKEIHLPILKHLPERQEPTGILPRKGDAG